jgi:hypothetical protein
MPMPSRMVSGRAWLAMAGHSPTMVVALCALSASATERTSWVSVVAPFSDVIIVKKFVLRKYFALGR